MECPLCDKFEHEYQDSWTAEIESARLTVSQEAIEAGEVIRHVMNKHKLNTVKCLICKHAFSFCYWWNIAEHYLECHSIPELEAAIVLRSLGNAADCR